jgi:hypothetical protein
MNDPRIPDLECEGCKGRDRIIVALTAELASREAQVSATHESNSEEGEIPNDRDAA